MCVAHNLGPHSESRVSPDSVRVEHWVTNLCVQHITLNTQAQTNAASGLGAMGRRPAAGGPIEPNRYYLYCLRFLSALCILLVMCVGRGLVLPPTYITGHTLLSKW